MTAVRSTLRPAERGIREAIKGVDQAVRESRSAAEERERALMADRKLLEKSLGDLTGQVNGNGRSKPRRRRKAQRTHEDFVKLAGRSNVEKVGEYLEKKGRAFQSDMTRDLKMSSGNASHALKAWASHPDGSKIRLTGQVKRSSKEYEWIGSARDSSEEPIAEEKEVVASTA